MKRTFTKTIAAGLLMSLVAGSASASHFPSASSSVSGWGYAFMGSLSALVTGGSLYLANNLKDKVGTDSQEKRESAVDLKEKAQNLNTMDEFIDFQNEIAWADLKRKDKQKLVKILNDVLRNPAGDGAASSSSAVRPSPRQASDRSPSPKMFTNNLGQVSGINASQLSLFKKEFAEKCDDIIAANQSYLPNAVLYGLTGLGAGVATVAAVSYAKK